VIRAGEKQSPAGQMVVPVMMRHLRQLVLCPGCTTKDPDSVAFKSCHGSPTAELLVL